MSLALQKPLAPATGAPARPGTGKFESKLSVDVVFTSIEPTLAALKKAGALAGGLNARITLLVAQIVPYPLPLESPPVLLDFNERRFRKIANQSPVETTVRLYQCRDQLETLASVLEPHSLWLLVVEKDGGQPRKSALQVNCGGPVTKSFLRKRSKAKCSTFSTSL